MEQYTEAARSRFPLSTLAARWEASLKERKGRVNPGLKTAAKKVELKEAA